MNNPGIRYRLLFTLLCLSATGLAQSVYNWHHYGMPGDTNRMSVTAGIDFSGIDTLTGPDFIWDYTDLNSQTQVVQQFVERDATGFFPSFLAACALDGSNPFECIQQWESLSSQALVSIDSLSIGPITLNDALQFQRVTPQALEVTMVGFQFENEGLELPLILIYDNPDTVFHFPLNYLDADTTRYSWELDLTDFNLDINYKAQQTRSYVVDGWGTLRTPFRDDLSALRTRTTITNEDTLIINGNVLPLNNTTTLIAWYDTSYSMPVLEIVRSIGAISNIFSVRYMDSARCILPTAGFSIDPPSPVIDTSGNARIQLQNASINAARFFWDFGDGNTSQRANPSHTYAAPGAYQVTLIACNPVCDPVACDTVVLPVTVRDTTTSTATAYPLKEPELYPNPAHFKIHIDHPENIEDLQVIDQTGHMIPLRTNSPNAIRIDMLKPGMYWLSGKVQNGRFLIPFIKSD